MTPLSMKDVLKSYNRFALVFDHLPDPFRVVRSNKEVGKGSFVKYARQEQQVSIRGMIAILLYLRLVRKVTEDRDRCEAALRCLAELSCPNMATLKSRWDEMLLLARPLCAEEVHDGVCCHMVAHSDVSEPLHASSTPGAAMCSKLCCIFAAASATAACPALASLLSDVVGVLSVGLGDRIRNDEFVVSAADLKLARQDANKRRMRLDEDYKSYMIEDALRNKKGRTAASVMRAQTEAPDGSCALKWIEARVSSQLRATARSLKVPSGVFFFALDGVRAGEPAEETLFSVFHGIAEDVALIPPPMVPHLPRVCFIGMDI
jgi:hypothetical protein